MILRKLCKILIILGVLTISSAWAETDANDLYQAERWAEALEAYTAIVAGNPDDGLSWLRLAVSARRAERYDVALNALSEADDLEFASLQVKMERARLKVLSGDTEGAVADLQAVAASGFTAVGIITSDPVLGTLAGNAAFDSMVAEMSVAAYPCEHDEAFSAFDFWVGEWEVHGAGGTYAGSNVIERAERGCVLIEIWSSASGGSGMSINYLDKVSGEWVQVWNDASGSQINIRGGMTEEGMLLVGTIHYVSSGSTQPFRGLWTLLPDGRVRQFFETSADDGETWTSWFEGFYTRKSVE
ncbi:MAG: tetratricopeptide repeat protein [Proteobacteria bacterium]|nr:tetratricopeptide repeat protein [Pseudomonadota bacterium]